MPLLASGDTAATLMDQAEIAATASFMADKQTRVLTPDEVVQLKHTVRAAGLNALFTHIAANAALNGTVAVGLATGVGGGPVVGALIVPPPVIS